MWKSICIWAVVQWWMREIFLNWKIKKFSIPRTSFVVLGNLLGKTPIFQALRYWKILFSPSDFEPTSVRNCQFLTLPVRNCQHADPYQVLGLERSEQQCVLDTRRHQPTPTRCWGLNNLPEDFSNMNCFHFTRCAENLACSKGSRDKLFSPKAWIGHFVLSLSFTGYMLNLLSENKYLFYFPKWKGKSGYIFVKSHV